MRCRLSTAFVAFGVVFAAAQLVRPERANPPTNPTRTIAAYAGSTSELAAVLNRSCRDCHSNGMVWPSYAHVAPASWLMAYAVTKGRNAISFSEWGTYAPDVQQAMLSASCDDVASGKMPGLYTILRPETRLSAQDIETVCTAARQAAAQLRAGGVK